MTVREMLDLLENYVDDDAEVLMATQRSRPLQFTISHVYDTEDADGPVVYLVEGRHPDSGPYAPWEVF